MSDWQLDPRFDSFLAVQICQAVGFELRNKTSGRVMTSHGDHGHKTPCMSIDLDNNWFRCFSCGESGSLTGLYWNEFGRSAYRDFERGSYEGDFNPVRLRNYERDAVDFEKTPEVGFAFEGSVVSAKNHPLGKKFLEQRQLLSVSDEIKAQFCIKGFTYLKSDPKKRVYFTDRVIIPVYESGKLVSIEGRDVKGEENWAKSLEDADLDPSEHAYKKVLFPSGSTTDTLWRLDKLKADRPLYVCEGIMDAASLMTHESCKNSTALFRAVPTVRQLYLLKKFDKVVVVPDRDQAGARTLKALKKSGIKADVLMLPEGAKDASDVQQGKIKRFESVSDLVSRGWLRKPRPLSIFDIDEFERLLVVGVA